MPTGRHQQTYDHRLVRLVQETGDASIATRIGVPRSTAAGWLRRGARAVTAAPGGDAAVAVLRVQLARTERRCQRLSAVLRVLFSLLRTLKPDLSRLRVAELDKPRLLRAVDRTRDVLGLRRVLSILGLSPSRLSAWRRAARACELADEPSCPGSSPQRLTPAEISKVREMVRSPDPATSRPEGSRSSRRELARCSRPRPRGTGWCASADDRIRTTIRMRNHLGQAKPRTFPYPRRRPRR